MFTADMMKAKSGSLGGAQVKVTRDPRARSALCFPDTRVAEPWAGSWDSTIPGKAAEPALTRGDKGLPGLSPVAENSSEAGGAVNAETRIPAGTGGWLINGSIRGEPLEAESLCLSDPRA